jgi:hypothetical protein
VNVEGGTARRVRDTSRSLLIGVLVAIVVLGILDLAGAFSNGDAYGRVDIPGSRVLRLPKREVDVSFEAQMTSTDGGGGLVVPPLSLTVERADGRGPDPAVVQSFGSSTSVNGDAHERVWKVRITMAGPYRVIASGEVGPYVDPQLTFGRDASLAPFFDLLFVLLVGSLVVWVLARRDVRRAAAGQVPVPTGPPTPAPSRVIGGVPGSASREDAVLMRLDKLADLRERGALTEEEFAAEKARILAS